jgi:hypothetical protein
MSFFGVPCFVWKIFVIISRAGTCGLATNK